MFTCYLLTSSLPVVPPSLADQGQDQLTLAPHLTISFLASLSFFYLLPCLALLPSQGHQISLYDQNILIFACLFHSSNSALFLAHLKLIDWSFSPSKKSLVTVSNTITHKTLTNIPLSFFFTVNDSHPYFKIGNINAITNITFVDADIPL